MAQETGIKKEERSEEGAPAYVETMAALKQAEQELPDFTSSYDGEIGRLTATARCGRDALPCRTLWVRRPT